MVDLRDPLVGHREAAQMFRRDLLAGALLFFVGVKGSARAFEAPVRIGVLTSAWGAPEGLGGLIAGLVELGYRENDDFVLGVRFTRGDLSALPAAAREMVELGVDIVVVIGETAAKAAKAATSSHPIIFLGTGDPVGRGLIESFNRPGANVTGVTTLDLEVSGKRLELFKDLVPGLRRFAYSFDKNDAFANAQADAYRTASLRLGLDMIEFPVTTETEARDGLAGLAYDDVQGLVAPRGVGLNLPGVILEAEKTMKVPAMFAGAAYLAEGGFSSYGGAANDMGHQAAVLADKIIRGADPAELPVETVRRLELVVNVRAARELGLEIPRLALFQADRIIW